MNKKRLWRLEWADENGKPHHIEDPISFEFAWTFDRLDSRDSYFDLLDAQEKDRWPDLMMAIIGLSFIALSGGLYLLELDGQLNRQFTAAFAFGGLLMFGMLVALGLVQNHREKNAPVNPNSSVARRTTPNGRHFGAQRHFLRERA